MHKGLFCRTTYVYLFRNVFNNKIYVGETSYPKEREKQHRKALREGSHSCTDMQIDYNTYGDVFEFIIVKQYETEREARDSETQWMERLFTFDPRFGYNVRDWKTSPMRRKHGLDPNAGNHRRKVVATNG